MKWNDRACFRNDACVANPPLHENASKCKENKEEQNVHEQQPPNRITHANKLRKTKQDIQTATAHGTFAK